MKATLLITFVLVGVSHQLNLEKLVNDFEDVVDKEARDCYGEFNLNRAMLDEKLKALEFPNDRNFKCFYHCIITHLNVFDKDGNMVIEKVKNYFDVEEEVQKRVFDNCKDIQEEDGCEKFYQMALCARKYIE
ncbi:hypothetical protein FQR65_LT09974 [Abscondita terminalis]|nr:hypothetical protein FQR65_LT09974 [Abscondita terminalis]